MIPIGMLDMSVSPSGTPTRRVIMFAAVNCIRLSAPGATKGSSMTTERSVVDGVALVLLNDRYGNSQHWYRVGDDPILLPSVTHILKGTMNWQVVAAAAKETAWACVKGRKTLYAIAEGTSEAAAVEVFKRAYQHAWDAKKDRGINVHSIVATGGSPGSAEAPYVAQYERWLRDTGAEIIAQEVEVASVANGYGGRLDLIARLAYGSFGLRNLVVDIKTRDDLRVFPERLVQSAAYAKAELGLPCDIDGAAVLTLGREAYSFNEVEDIDAALRGFLGLRSWAEFLGKTTTKIEPRNE